MPRLRHFDNLNTGRFVTFSCYKRYQLLTYQPAISIFLMVLDELRSKSNVRLLGYVVMPEHVHLVLHPPDGLKIGQWVGELKSRSARRIFAAGHPDERRLSVGEGDRRRNQFWQPRCYDHNCRSDSTIKEKIRYCHKNPVTRGLVLSPGDWRWSSFGFYNGDSNVPLGMDEFI